MTFPKKTILFVGNHLSNSDRNKGVTEDLAIHLNHAGYETILTSSKLNKSSRLLDMLLTILCKQRFYDISGMDLFSGPAFLWAFLSVGLLKILRKPVIITLHGGNLPAYAENHPHLVRRLFNWANKLVSPSSYLIEQMKQYRPDIQLIPNAIDINLYLYRQRQKALPNLIWLRAFHEIYNPSLAVRMAEILKQAGIGFQIRMVGPDKGDGSYQRVLALVEEKGLGEVFQFPGGVKKEKVPEELNLGDIFLNTTNVDNTPISVMEAMASGLCIVSTNVGGIPFLLEDGVDALLVPPDDPQAMADAIRRIMSEPGLAGKLSANARRKAESFDWSVVLPQWEALFDKKSL